jgi:hypothetical protein
MAIKFYAALKLLILKVGDSSWRESCAGGGWSGQPSYLCLIRLGIWLGMPTFSIPPSPLLNSFPPKMTGKSRMSSYLKVLPETFYIFERFLPLQL